ncbi:hypothetical protein [Modestobacter sp. DSM 44400]|uniref:hypothetical protein n=1 Tax=Modestobacter sp. DSM 44400 TaxID=1550230 RepID=UPI0011154650|nr:hypothetical protein [Modestobacter sp. DSM 44400]
MSRLRSARSCRSSLRTKLPVAFVVPLVVVLALVGVVSVTSLEQELVSQVDTRLEAVTYRSENYSPHPATAPRRRRRSTGGGTTTTSACPASSARVARARAPSAPPSSTGSPPRPVCSARGARACS